MEKRLVEIEKRLAFQERHIEELNEALVEQQKRIQALEARVKGFEDQMTSGDLVKRPEDETPPPHY